MIRDALNEYAKSLNKVWAHDRTKTVGASEIGQCARKVFWTKNEKKPDEGQEDTWGARTRGTIMEDKFWWPAMRAKYGRNLRYAGRYQKTFMSGFLSATPDGLLINQKLDCLRPLGVKNIESDCLLIEAKSIDPRVNLQKEKVEHTFQVQVQLGLVRAKTKYKPTYALISYMDASFWHEILEFPVKFDQSLFDAAMVRAGMIMEAKSADELRPEGWIAGGNDCEYCPFMRACNLISKSVPENELATNDPQFVAEVTDLCRTAKRFAAQEDAACTAKKDIQEQIKEKLRKKGVRKIPKVVTWSAQKGRSVYDMKALSAAAEKIGFDVEAFSTAGEPSDRILITLSELGEIP